MSGSDLEFGVSVVARLWKGTVKGREIGKVRVRVNEEEIRFFAARSAA
jgi:hypothetical protein